MLKALYFLTLSSTFACHHRRDLSESNLQPMHVVTNIVAPRVCISPVPSAGAMKGHHALWLSISQNMIAMELEDAEIAMNDASDHPGFQSLAAGVAFLKGDIASARSLQRDLINAYPEDSCLAQTAAIIYMHSGEPAMAETYANDAIEMRPDDVNALYIYALTRTDRSRQGHAAVDALESVLALQPDHGGANYFIGLDRMGRGYIDEALPLLERAHHAGIDTDIELAQAYFVLGQTGEYLRLGARLGWPIIDAKAISDSSDPLATFKNLIGVGQDDRLLATLITSMGEIECDLYWKRAPITVANFVGLATGTQPWQTVPGNEIVATSIYENTLFHRVIPEFMIQGGDPEGTGLGGPGYRFRDEIDPQLTFSSPGVLAMANSGANTNGSQFFVTDAPTQHLNGRHTIFGQCTPESHNVVHRIATAPTGADNRPIAEIRLLDVQIHNTDSHAAP